MCPSFMPLCLCFRNPLPSNPCPSWAPSPIGFCVNLGFYHVSLFALGCGMLYTLCLLHLPLECLEGTEPHWKVASNQCLWHLLIFYSFSI